MRTRPYLINWGYSVRDAAICCYGGANSAEPLKRPYVNFPLP